MFCFRYSSHTSHKSEIAIRKKVGVNYGVNNVVCCELEIACREVVLNPTNDWVNSVLFQYYSDKAVQREVFQLIVLCSYSIYGCPWQGQLQHLEVSTHQVIWCSPVHCSLVRNIYTHVISPSGPLSGLQVQAGKVSQLWMQQVDSCRETRQACHGRLSI